MPALATISRDTETRTRYTVDGVLPDAVALPEDESEVAEALKLAAGSGTVVVPWGAGTKQDFGHPLDHVGLVISLERLNRVIDYVPADMTITVEAGMRLADLQTLTAPHGQHVALDPPRADRASIGGIVAAGSYGPRRAAYGGPRDLLLGVHMALADGRVTRCGGKVVKNVAGYDMTRLAAGSLGTLGIITEVSLKLRPAPADSRTLLFAFPDMEGALTTSEQILRSELLPAALAVLSPQAARRLEVPGKWPLAVALEESAENNEYQVQRLTKISGSAVEVGPSFWPGATDYKDRFAASCRYRISTVIEDISRQLRAAASLDRVVYVGSGTIMLYGYDDQRPPGGASAVLESGSVALRKRVEVWGPPRPEWQLSERIKRALDPGRILNRGRFVGGI